MDERKLRIGWVDRVVNEPDWTIPDPNEPGAIRAFGSVPERDMSIMRVVYVPDGDDKRVASSIEALNGHDSSNNLRPEE